MKPFKAHFHLNPVSQSLLRRQYLICSQQPNVANLTRRQTINGVCNCFVIFTMQACSKAADCAIYNCFQCFDFLSLVAVTVPLHAVLLRGLLSMLLSVAKISLTHVGPKLILNSLLWLLPKFSHLLRIQKTRMH